METFLFYFFVKHVTLYMASGHEFPPLKFHVISMLLEREGCYDFHTTHEPDYHTSG